MASIDNHVRVSVVIQNQGVPRDGFGLGLYASHNATWPERFRSYTDSSSVSTEFGATSPEARVAGAYFAQTPRPPKLFIGRVDSEVLMRYELSIDQAVNDREYAFVIASSDHDDAEVTYTADAATSVAEIANGLLTAINAVADRNYLATFAALVFADTAVSAVDFFNNELDFAAPHGRETGDGPVQFTTTGTLPAGLALATNYWIVRRDTDSIAVATSLANALAGTVVDITDVGAGTHTMVDTAGTTSPASGIVIEATASGEWFAVEIDEADFDFMSVAVTHAAGTLDEDLDAIFRVNKEWYTLLTAYNSRLYVQEAAAWAEANERTYWVDMPDTASVTTAQVGATDSMAALQAFGYENTMYSFHNRPSDMFSAAWAGRFLPTLPGKATPKFKELSGVRTVNLTQTQRDNLIARRGNSYETVATRNMTYEGMVANTTHLFFDVVRNKHWLTDELKKALFGTLVGADVVPFTAEGTAQVLGTVKGTLEGIAVDQGVLAADPAPTASVPNITDEALVTANDKTTRKLRNVKGSGTLQGAVHSVEADITVVF